MITHNEKECYIYPIWQGEALPIFGYYPTNRSTQPSKYLSFKELAELVANPLNLEKNKAPLITPHTAQAKTKEEAKEASYNAVVIDFDNVDYSVQQGLEKVKALYSGTFLYFTTASHKQEGKGNRFKVVIPLETALNSEDYSELATGISLLFGADIAQARITQGFYAPNTQNRELYQGGEIQGDGSRLNANTALFHQAIERYTTEKQKQRKKAELAPLKPRNIEAYNSSIIELIKDAYSIEGLLQAKGYRQQGREWLAPNSTSGIPGVHILGDRVYSHHTSDPLGAINNGGHSLDVADALAILDYNGDFKAMIKEQSERLDPEGQKKRQQAYTEAQASNDEEIEPIFHDSDPYNLFGGFKLPEMNMELIPKAIANYAIDQGELIGADPATLVIFSLGVVASCITDKLQIQPKKYDYGWKESARIWSAVIGDPSIKKSPLLKKAVSPLWKIEKEWRESNKAKLSAWIEKTEKAKNEGAELPARPLEKRLIIEDATIEKMGEILSNAEPRGILVVRDELSGWLGGMDAYKGGSKDKPAWLESYNGGAKIFDRISRGETFVENWSASIIGGIQPSVIHAYARATEHDGLLQRFILFYAKPARQGVDRIPNKKAKEAYYSLISHLAGLNGSDNPVTLSDGARAIREEFERKIDRIAQNHQSQHIKATLGKWSGLYVRLLLIWHCVEMKDKSLYPTAEQVEAETAKKVARFLWENILPHTLKFYGDIDPLEDKATELANLILAREWKRFTVKRDFNQYWKASRAMKQWEIQATLDRLEGFNWITPDNRTLNINGTATAYIVNERVHELYNEQKQREQARRAEIAEAMAELKAFSN